MDEQSLYAAIDLGSVSFHLVIMAKRNGKLVWVDCKKEIVRLASGLDPDTGTLRPEVQKRALKCLNYFRRQLGRIPRENIRAVGTSTFRRLKDANQFLAECEKTLSLPISVLSGQDEAKYIYRGVACNLPHDNRFVIDIGGGSTEFIVGEGKRLVHCESMDLGCITLSQQYFSGNELNPKQFAACEQQVAETLRPIAPAFQNRNWDSELGTSGSIKAVSWALQHQDFSDGEITREALDEMRAGILTCKDLPTLAKFLNLNHRRTSVFCAGFIILQQAFKELGLSYIRVSQGAIREGLIDELIDESENVMAAGVSASDTPANEQRPATGQANSAI